jgi:predicted RNA binding protein YcfA (HicA-like mRNA interferase family)
VFKHPIRPGIVVVPHPKKDLGIGLVTAIRKQAGLQE